MEGSLNGKVLIRCLVRDGVLSRHKTRPQESTPDVGTRMRGCVINSPYLSTISDGEHLSLTDHLAIGTSTVKVVLHDDGRLVIALSGGMEGNIIAKKCRGHAEVVKLSASACNCGNFKAVYIDLKDSLLPTRTIWPTSPRCSSNCPSTIPFGSETAAVVQSAAAINNATPDLLNDTVSSKMIPA